MLLTSAQIKAVRIKMELLFYQGQMCLLFMCMLGHCVASTVLVVPEAFRGRWQRRWTATQRVPLQWHKQFRQSLEEGARKQCSRVCSSVCLPWGITGGLKAPCICFDHVAGVMCLHTFFVPNFKDAEACMQTSHSMWWHEGPLTVTHEAVKNSKFNQRDRS